MKQKFIILAALFTVIFIACETSEIENTDSIVSEPQLYRAPGEQMYKMEITPSADEVDVPFIGTLRPVNLTKEDWPVLTFAIEKDTLTITESTQDTANPVNPEGHNKFFYQKMKELLLRENLDIVVPKQYQRFFLIDGEGVVREIVENSPDIAYLSKVALVVNSQDAAVSLTVYKKTKSNSFNTSQEGVYTLKGLIPVQGFLLLKIEDMKDIIRIDVGNEAHVITKRTVSALQQSVDKLYNAPINYKKFLQTNSSGKVFKANKEGGSIGVTRFGGINNIHIPPNEVVVYFGRSGEEATPSENVISYTEIVVF